MSLTVALGEGFCPIETNAADPKSTALAAERADAYAPKVVSRSVVSPALMVA
jgi:hypothetical protein